MPSITLVWGAGVANAAQATPFLDIERAITRVIRESNQSNNLIQLQKIIQLPNKGVKIFTESEICIQNLQIETNKLKFSERIGLQFQPSLERLASCTLVIRPHNASAFDDADDVIAAAVRRAAGAPVDEPITIWRSNDRKTVKLIFQHRTYAETVQKNGFGVGGFYFSKYRIQFGEYFHINQCMKCFEFETHTTRNCKSTTLLCSECGSEGHIWRHCPQPSPPRCINCRKRGQDCNHRTLANTCPLKKEIIRRKRDEKYQKEKHQEHLPVIQAVQNTITTMMAQPPPQSVAMAPRSWPSLGNTASTPAPASAPAPVRNDQTIDQQIKVITTLAHQHNVAFPGTFNEKLNYLLARNHIATVDVGEDWPSGQILKAIGAQAVAADAGGEDLLLMDEESVLREPSPTITSSIFPSYWPEHDLSFSEPSSPEKSPKNGPKNSKKKKKKKVKNLTQISTEEEEETEEEKLTHEKKEIPEKEEITETQKKEEEQLSAPQPPVQPVPAKVRIEDGEVIFPCGKRVPVPQVPNEEGFQVTRMEHVTHPTGCPEGGMRLIYTKPNSFKTYDAYIPYKYENP